MNCVRKLHLLIGDDGTPFARHFAESMCDFGCECSVYRQTTDNMVRRVTKEQPDAVILDISTGSPTHYHLLKAIQKCSAAPVFAVTAAFRPMMDTDLCREGLVSVHKKPVEYAAMLREIALCVYGTQAYAHYRSTTIEIVVSGFLQRLGAAPNMTGFRYLHTILCRTIVNPGLVHGICSKLYPQIADRYHVNVPCIERNIRTLLANVWLNSNLHLLSEALHYPMALLHNRLPNAKFIACATESLRMDSRVRMFLEDTDSEDPIVFYGEYRSTDA